MRLESKLGIGTGVLVLAMFLSALLVHLRMTGVVDLANQVGKQRQPFIFRMEILRGDIADTVISLESHILLESQLDPRSRIHSGGATAQKAVTDDLALLVDHDNHLDLGQDEGALAPLFQQVQELLQLERQVGELIDRGNPDDLTLAHEILQGRVLPLTATLDQKTAAIIQSQKALEGQEMARVFHADQVMVQTLWTATALGAFLGGIFSFVLSRRITRSIDLVAARADAIAAGDLTGAPLDVDPNDQIGALARAMQQMQQSLAGIIGTVVHTAGTLTSSARCMTLASDQVHRRVDQQTQQTQQAATAMQEMSASITEVSHHTQSAAETARAAAQTAHEGGTIVRQMLASMGSIATAVSDTSASIGLLGEDSVRISQIVTVIETIAHNTNLLALNAAIEAARAGEQGRGFAVVAAEVRRLAESTAQATGQISAMVQGIQARTRTAIDSMASGTSTVQQGVATTNQAGEALGRIIGMAERVERMVTQIAIAASQQAAAADQSSVSLDAIHTLAHENLTEMATTTSGIESLRTTATTLERQVERFRLDTIPPAAGAQRDVAAAGLTIHQPALA